MIVLSWFRYLVPFLNTCLSGSIYVLSQPVLSQPYLAMVKAPKTKQRALEKASVGLQPLPFTRRVTLASGAVIVRPPAAAGSLYVHRCGFCTDAFKSSSGLAQHIFHKHQNFTKQGFKNDLTAEGDEEQLYFGVPATPSVFRQAPSSSTTAAAVAMIFLSYGSNCSLLLRISYALP